ncbi:hypothetical protein SDJN03_16586, partial [Cucurbita argyrosperma subsp. sororia]
MGVAVWLIFKAFIGHVPTAYVLSKLESTSTFSKPKQSISNRTFKGYYFRLMASKLTQLQSKATQASQYVLKHGCSYYKQLLEQNKQFIQEPPTVEKCNLLSKQLFYTRLASIPGRYESFHKELDYVKQLWKNRQDLKVEEAGIAALFGLECFAWFCAGEIVGRGFTFTGYYV